MRDKLAGDEKIADLVRELGALEKTLNKMRAENYLVSFNYSFSYRFVLMFVKSLQ